MPVANFSTSGTLNTLKSEEANDSCGTVIKKAIEINPLPRVGDNSMQWIQLFHALEQPELPGWPLMTSLKVQMQKCEKCSREFCSPVNYRRHIRVHRRSLNVNKESYKNRDLLAAFWDKLSLEEAKEVMSFDDVMLKEIPGSSVVRALASSLHNIGFLPLPQVYMNAGSILLDIVQAKPYRVPISSYELFSVLDDASEGTFLCGGTAESVKKYVFDGETIRNSMELKNLVASMCFLFEQQLVKAWIADKDAEALRCQKLLVEEEEYAQKRQADLLEKKRQKKLRKELKMKQQFYANNGDLEAPALAKESGVSSASDSTLSSLDVPVAENLASFMEMLQLEPERDIEAQLDPEPIEPHIVGTNGFRQLTSNRRHISKSQRDGRFGFHLGQNLQTFKPEPVHKLGPSKDRTMQSGNRIWTKKFKVKSNTDILKPPVLETSKQIEENKCEVMIGSIPITLQSSVTQLQDHAMLKKVNGSEKLIKNDLTTSVANRVVSKHWRPMSHDETKTVLPADRVNEDSMLDKVCDRVVSSDCDGNLPQGSLPFCSATAKEFLAQRWKKSISADHVKLVISSGDVQNDHSTPSHVSDLRESGGVGITENQVGRSIQIKFGKKPEKGLIIKYIPKQKAVS